MTVMASSVSLDQLVVDFLRKRGFLKTLKSFISETGLVRAFLQIFPPFSVLRDLVSCVNVMWWSRVRVGWRSAVV
jgi:hypothetical protein